MKVFSIAVNSPILSKSQNVSFGIKQNSKELKSSERDTFNHSKNYYNSLLKNADSLIGVFCENTPKINFEMNGKRYNGQYFSDGAVKAVYTFNEAGKKNVICLPSDYMNSIIDWDEVFKEPKNTNYIKSLGLLANDCCKIQPIKINGVLFPAVIMRHYDEHGFKIYDSKTFRDDAPKLDEIINLSDVSYEQLSEIFEGVGKDINILVKNDVCLFSDSYCFAGIEGKKLRLFFHDLGSVPYNDSIKSPFPMSKKEKSENAERIISNLCNVLSYSFESFNAAKQKEKDIVKILRSHIDI